MAAGTPNPALAATLPMPAGPDQGDALGLLSALGDRKRLPALEKYLREFTAAKDANAAAVKANERLIAAFDEREAAARDAEAQAIQARQKLADETQALSDLRDKLNAEDRRLKTWADEIEALRIDVAKREASLRRAFEGYQKENQI